MCQFLPQDRLEDFSKLDCKGLLLNALQSIGEYNLIIALLLLCIKFIILFTEDQVLLIDFEKLKKLAINKFMSDVDLKKLLHNIEIETATNSK